MCIVACNRSKRNILEKINSIQLKIPRYLCLVTSPVGTVAKYCDEHVGVCLSVCLYVREDISRTICAIFTEFFVHVANSHGSILFWQSYEIPRGRSNFGVFFPSDSALYSIAFETHTKQLNRSRCRLG